MITSFSSDYVVTAITMAYFVPGVSINCTHHGGGHSDHYPPFPLPNLIAFSWKRDFY